MAKYTKHRNSTLLPVVEKSDLERLSGPQMRLSRGKTRALVEKGIISKGFSVPIKTHRGVAGRRKFHSGLSLLALQAFAAGDHDTAESLGKSAASFEVMFRPFIERFLADHDASELPHAPFWNNMVEATAGASENFRPDFVFADGVIAAIKGEEAYIEATRTKDGSGTKLPVPLEIVRAQGLSEGASVWVLRSVSGTNVVISIVPTVPSNADDEGAEADDAYLRSEAGSRTLTVAQIAYLRSLDQDSLPVVRIVG